MKTAGRQESANIDDRNAYSMGDIMFYPDRVSKDQFLIDTFKRARSIGYPIHGLLPYLDQLPAERFTKDQYDSVVISNDAFVGVPKTSPGLPKFNDMTDRVRHTR